MRLLGSAKAQSHARGGGQAQGDLSQQQKKTSRTARKEREAHRRASSCEKSTCTFMLQELAELRTTMEATRGRPVADEVDKASAARVSVGSFRRKWSEPTPGRRRRKSAPARHACAYARSARQNGPRPARRGKDMLQSLFETRPLQEVSCSSVSSDTDRRAEASAETAVTRSARTRSRPGRTWASCITTRRRITDARANPTTVGKVWNSSGPCVCRSASLQRLQKRRWYQWNTARHFQVCPGPVARGAGCIRADGAARAPPAH